jgi:hypothetical protein
LHNPKCVAIPVGRRHAASGGPLSGLLLEPPWRMVLAAGAFVGLALLWRGKLGLG